MPWPQPRFYWSTAAAKRRCRNRRNRPETGNVKQCEAHSLDMSSPWKIWLVVSNMNFSFHFIYGMSSQPHWLSLHHFSRWLVYHQPVLMLCSWNSIQCENHRYRGCCSPCCFKEWTIYGFAMWEINSRRNVMFSDASILCRLYRG